MKQQTIFECIRRTAIRQNYLQQSNGELLKEYIQTKESAVFAELIERLAPLVWGVCRRVLRDEHTSEDAFQATFLTLARKADTIRSPEHLSGWIYRVARHIATELATSKTDPIDSLTPDIPDSSPTSLDRISAKELLQAIDTEVEKLPENYRTAVLLCWFQDVSLDSASKQLGISKGKLWGWLKRARELLRARLGKKGYGLPSILGAGSFVPSRVSAKLIQETVDRVASGKDCPNGGALLVNLPGEVSTSLLRKGSLMGISLVTILGFALTLLSGAENQSKEKTLKNNLAPKAVETKPVSDGFPLPPGAEFRFGNRQMRHPEWVMNSALSPDGKYLATSGYRIVVIWDTKTLAAKHVIKDSREVHFYPPIGLTGLHFTSDSKQLVVSYPIDSATPLQGPKGSFAVAQIVDVETGKKISEVKITGFPHPYSPTWISGNAKETITFCNGNISYWNIQEGKESPKVALDDHPLNIPWITNGVDRIAFVSQKHQQFKVYDTKTGKELYSTNDQVVLQATFSPDGKTLVYQTPDKKMHICNLETKKEMDSFLHPETQEVEKVPMRIGKDNRTLFFGSHNGILFRWDLKENKKLPNLGRHSLSTLNTMATSSEEKILYTMGYDKVIQRWDLIKNEKLPLPEGGYLNQLCMTLTTDGKRLFIGDHNNEDELFEWDLATGKLVQKWKGSESWGVNSLGRSSDGKWLACGTFKQEVQLWDLSLGKVTKSIPLDQKPERRTGGQVQKVEFSPDNKVLYTTSWKTGLSAYEIDSEKLLWRVPAGNEFTCSPDGKWIVSSEPPPREGPIQFHLRDSKTGKSIKTFEVKPELPGEFSNPSVYPPWISQFCVVPDGSLLISSHYDGTIRIWDWDLAREIRKLKLSKENHLPVDYSHHEKWVDCSRDGRWLAAGCPDTKIRLYELSTGREVLRLEGHETLIAQLLFTQDGRSLISNADMGPLKWTLRPSDLPKLPDSLNEIWESLGSDDSAKVYRLLWALIDHPKIVIKLCESKIKPEDFTRDRKRFDKLILDLDSTRFTVRETAQKEIIDKAECIPITWLTQAFQASKAQEQKNRLEKLIELRHQGLSLNTLRMNRALYALEQLHSPQAKELLQKYANGPQGPLADLAKAALKRSTP